MPLGYQWVSVGVSGCQLAAVGLVWPHHAPPAFLRRHVPLHGLVGGQRDGAPQQADQPQALQAGCQDVVQRAHLHEGGGPRVYRV